MAEDAVQEDKPKEPGDPETEGAKATPPAPPPPPAATEEEPEAKAEEAEEVKCEDCPECPPVGAPAWMATFADMATLLMAFFVVLLSFAEMNVPKFKQISGSMKNSFGVQRLIPTVEPPKAQSLIAQQFSPAVAQPTVIDTIRQETTDETQREVELKTETKTEDPRPDPQTMAQAKAVEKALAEEVAKGLVEVRAEGQKVVVQMNPPMGREAGRGGGSGDEGQKSAGGGSKGAASAGAADKGEKSMGAMGQKGESTGGVVNQETIELFAKIAEAQAQVTAQVEVRQAGPQTGSRSGATGPDGKSTGSGGGGANESEVANRFEQIKADLAKEIAAGQAEVMRDGLKIVIRLAEQGSFVSGRADLQPGFTPLLQKVGKTISSGTGQVKIEGHTDNVPVIMNDRFKSNWDLSAARSSAVADYISSRAGVQMSRISVSGHADTRPVDTNNTAEGRARNRRIEIIVDG
jgi:chemotaxis protein MotB